MKEEIIIAGFGGQGVMSMGQFLTYAGLKEGKEVTWFPSYGPEQRGGTANVSVVISDQPVDSPVIDEPTAFLALNKPSFNKFYSHVKESGNIFINSDLITNYAKRNDVVIHEITATQIAQHIGNERIAGMVLLGAFIEKTGILSKESLYSALKDVLGESKKHLIPMNKKAILEGIHVMQD
ncbi:2-oxoacid:acceptor oxidoreductase family protein [Evansella sp. AB-P1]|uniref:2-oxoacid:acceptor oxidoreductase family protein n=1 Tax=Evansella sp. AB-P1 TaxID=3037653 RepID=UPI00241C0A4C|nr:2-oxoacid:acceptor oxidoreductase family protein [Evansella sp. AB-P1]MDG5787632.1 2-oxoacid:acceptor oxidoreductase family protein [Evansella sp. AB-P1]